MLQLSFYGHPSVANFSQRFGLTHLAKKHRYELSPTTESPRMPLGLVFVDLFLQLHSGKQLQPLRENAAYSIHGGILL
jgi:hypothetical protein